jgi:ech hydrogenase subunit D
MSQQIFEKITSETLLVKVRQLKVENYRLVQISATRLPDDVELTYSFDREGSLINLRLIVPAASTKIASITSVYWCAFLYENELHDLFNLEVEGMAVDFHGNLYRTTVKFPFGSYKAPTVKAAPPATPAGPKREPARPPLATPTHK